MAGKETTLLYDRDFFEWTARNAQLLREGRLAEADLEHLAEEIEDVGKRDQREVRNRLQVLLTHLLKWKYQPQRRYLKSGKSSWLSTIRTRRMQLRQIFEQSPSLQRHGQESIGKIFCQAAEDAAYQTNLQRGCFPAECPFRFEQIIDGAFLPD